MDALAIIIGLAENNAWASHRLLTACAQLTEAERRLVRMSFFPTIHGTLTHIELVDEYYADALAPLAEGGRRGLAIFDDEDPFAAFEPLASAQRAMDQRLLAFCRSLRDERALDDVIHIPRAHGLVPERVGPVLLHLFEHQLHHRGQVHAMLAGTRVAPPQLDEFFLDGDAASRERELRELGIDRR